jgi:hypothetical protein
MCFSFWIGKKCLLLFIMFNQIYKLSPLSIQDPHIFKVILKVNIDYQMIKQCLIDGTPTKLQVQNVRFQNVRFQNVWNVRFTKRQLYKMSGLQNVRLIKRQVFKTSGCKKTSIYILYFWLVEIRRFCCSHVFRQSDGCVLFSILEGYFAICHHNH